MNKGSSAGILLSPTHLILVWNIKFITMTYELLNTKPHNFSDWKDNFESWRKQRSLPRPVRDWVYNELNQPGQQMVKGDKYGFGCGHIEARDEHLAVAQNDQENYPHYAAMREFREEIGLRIAKEEDGVKKICFEHVGTQLEEDHETHKLSYPTHIYWIKEAYGQLNKKGFEGETEAPEAVIIKSLTPLNFYPKHAFALKKTLERLVGEYGMREYRQALDYITTAFAKTEGRFKDSFIDAEISIPSLDLSDEKLWGDYIAMRKDIIPMRK